MNEPATEPASAPEPESPRRAGWPVLLVAGLILAVAIGVATTPFWAPAVMRALPWSEARPSSPDPALSTRLAALETARSEEALKAVHDELTAKGAGVAYAVADVADRAGLQAVPRGQMEAALSLGIPRFLAVRRIILPQAVRLVIPATANDFIALFKDTAACSIIFVTELTRKYNELYNFNRSLIIELAFITAGLYLMMSYPMALLAQRLERRLGAARIGGNP